MDEAPQIYAGLAARSRDAQSSAAERWRDYLAEYSADMLRVDTDNELKDLLTDEQRAAGWLGYDGATEEELTELEERLGTRLPPSYRSFLAASNGWQNISDCIYELLSTRDVTWVNVTDDGFDEDGDLFGLEDLKGKPLLISGDADAAAWLLDSGDVSPDGEWAAYSFAAWNPGLDERQRSFADLVAEERAGFEELSGLAGRPVHPEGAEELLAHGRRLALRGEVDDALDAFKRAETKGSGAAAYLNVVLSAFLGGLWSHHILRPVLQTPHVVAELSPEQLGTEAVPLYLAAAWAGTPHGTSTHGTSVTSAIRELDEYLPSGLLPEPSETAEVDPDPWIVAHRAPEPPIFERALESARALAARGAVDEAWDAIRQALPEWYPMAENRIAPVVLLTDPALRSVITPNRAREVAFTPRGGDPPGESAAASGS